MSSDNNDSYQQQNIPEPAEEMSIQWLERNAAKNKTSENKTSEDASPLPEATCGETKSNHASSIRDDLLRLPDHVLTTKFFTYFGFKDYALTSCASQYLQAHWQTAHQSRPLPLYVPEDCRTLEEAVKRVQEDNRLTTIVLGKGEHQIDGEYLKISSTVKIVGRPDVPKEEIMVVGGIWFDVKKGIEENCHLQHMILRQAKNNGVFGESSFTMKDVIVEQCGQSGVIVLGTGVVGRCTNVEVRHCEQSGVVAAMGGSMTLFGAKTTVHHNCTTTSYNYGLKVCSSSSTIQLVFPLTKEEVSIDNGGGGNWGAGWSVDINQIKTIQVKPPAVFRERHRQSLTNTL